MLRRAASGPHRVPPVGQTSTAAAAALLGHSAQLLQAAGVAASSINARAAQHSRHGRHATRFVLPRVRAMHAHAGIREAARTPGDAAEPQQPADAPDASGTSLPTNTDVGARGDADDAAVTSASVPFPASPDVDVSAPSPAAATSSSAAAAAATISPASLASYYHLLPPDARPAQLAPERVVEVVQEHEYVVEHSPLRTALKSDSKHALPVFDRLRSLRALPFSLASYQQLLHGPFACELAAQSKPTHSHADAARMADPARPLSMANRHSVQAGSSSHVQGTNAASVKSAAPSQMAVDKRPQSQRRGASRSGKTMSAAPAATVPVASDASESTPAPTASSLSALSDLRRLLPTPNLFLGLLHSLSQRGEYGTIVLAYRELLEPMVNEATSTLEAFIAERAPPAAAAASEAGEEGGVSSASSSASSSSSDLSASVALSYIHSLQNPPFLDSALSMSLSAAMRSGSGSGSNGNGNGGPKLAKSIFNNLMAFQEKQHACFELFLWDLGMQVMQEAQQVGGGAGGGSGTTSTTTQQQLASASSLAKEFLHSSRPFNPFRAKPYVMFIEALTKGNNANGVAQLAATATGAAAAPTVAEAQAPPQKKHPRNARRAARRSAASLDAPVPPAASMPKVKPALQLFNRLLEQPATASLALSTGGGGAGGSSSTLAISSPTHFSFSWSNLSRNMLRGVVSVASGEFVALQSRHAPLLRAAEHIGRPGFDGEAAAAAAAAAGTLSHRDAEDLAAFEAILAAGGGKGEEEALDALNQFARKKREALELLEGISMHVLQSFIRNGAPAVQAQAASTAAAQSATAKSAANANATKGTVTAAGAAAASTPLATSSSAAPSVASYSQDNAKFKHWRLMKLLMCHTVSSPSQLLGSSAAASSASAAGAGGAGGAAAGAATPPPGYHPAQWSNRAVHALGSSEVRSQRQEIRQSLMSLYPQLFPSASSSSSSSASSSSSKSNVLDAPEYTPSPHVRRHLFHPLSQLADAHLGLVHAVLESYIHLAHSLVGVEVRVERLRTALERRAARQGREILRAEQLRTSSIPSAAHRARRTAHAKLVARLNATPLPPSPVRSLESLLKYMERELIHPREHTFTLLFHKGLFGGGLRTEVRYASTHGAPPPPVNDVVDVTDDASLFPANVDAGSDVSDLRLLQSILTGAGPSFRRIPSRVPGASGDLISQLIIDVVLPRPVTLHRPARMRQANSKPGRFVHEAHSKLFEAYSTATINVLHKQRRRVEKEEALGKIGGADNESSSFSTSSSALSITADPSSPSSSSSSPPSLPFSLVRDQSGLLNSLLGSLEFVWSHPVRPEVQEHVRAVVRAHLGAHALHGHAANLPKLVSRSMLAARWGMSTDRIAALVGSGEHSSSSAAGPSLYGFEPRLVRKALKVATREAAERRVRMDALRTQWRERDARVFGKWNQPAAYGAGGKGASAAIVGSGGASLLQLPGFVVPRRTLQDLLDYFARTNNLPSALHVYDRMTHTHVSCTFRSALNLLSLASKYMNYELVAWLLTKEALPLSRHSASKRARVWNVIVGGVTQFNTYSNVDVYMRFMAQVLTQVGTQQQQQQLGKGSQWMPSAARVPGVQEDLCDPFPSNKEDAASSTTSAQARKRQLDNLWRGWASRGGAAEILLLWDSIRARWSTQAASSVSEFSSSSSSSSTSLVAATHGAILDAASVDAFLAGVLHRSTGRDAITPLSGEAAILACGELLRHLAHHGQPLTAQQMQRIAIDLPLFVSAARAQSGATSGASAASSGVSDVSLDSFASDRAWQEFCTANHVPFSVRQRISTLATSSSVSTLEGRAHLLAAANTSLQEFFNATATVASGSTDQALSRSATRVSVLSLLLRVFNASIGPAGIDHAIDKLESLVEQQKQRA